MKAVSRAEWLIARKELLLKEKALTRQRDEIEAFRRHVGWRFRWLSAYGSDFNYDYRVSFTQEDVATGKIDYNYGSTGIISEEMSGLSEMVDTTYMYLDLTPLGRNETGPHYNLGDWVRHHDRYGVAGAVDAAGRFVAAQPEESSCRCGGF
jgi:predicted dithiol-disulfide oxidoreductase (DUF899 family)